MDLLTNLKTVDPEIQKAIDQELSRQREKLEMIASENIVSKAVICAKRRNHGTNRQNHSLSGQILPQRSKSTDVQRTSER